MKAVQYEGECNSHNLYGKVFSPQSLYDYNGSRKYLIQVRDSCKIRLRRHCYIKTHKSQDRDNSEESFICLKEQEVLLHLILAKIPIISLGFLEINFIQRQNCLFLYHTDLMNCYTMLVVIIMCAFY